MSMANYPEYGFGLVLTGDEITDFIRHFVRSTLAKLNRAPSDLMEIHLTGLDNDPEFLVDNYGADMNVRFYGDCREGKRFQSLDNKVDLEYEDMLAFWAEKQPDAIKAVYDGIDEVVEEFKSRIGEFLPKGFDYEAHIGYFHCVIYC